ncbi:MAG: hypothetical protein M3Z08_23110 [Chloroflexota bacterium]|nr:hypothetical protein [Chloroflexota bacterium]
MKSLLSICIVLSLATMLLVACGGSTAASNGNGGSGDSGGNVAVVHMSASDFMQSHVTLHKGDRLRLVDDAASVHIVMNGAWDGTTSKAHTEPGAPLVNQQFSGNDAHVIGPFTSAGSFRFYCTVHLGMNLTVTVV